MAARYKRGTWRVILKTGVEFTFEGRVRVHHGEDGYVCDVDLDSPDIVFYSGFDDIAAVLRVRENGSSGAPGDQP